MRSKWLFERLQLLLLSRSILLSFSFLLLLFYEMEGSSYTFPAYGILLFGMLFNLIYFLIFPYVKSWERFGTKQVFVDSLLVFALLYTTGGTTSLFSFLCFGVIIAWTLVSSGLASLYFSSLLTIFLSLLTILVFTKQVQHLPFFSVEWLGNPEKDRQKILVTLFAQALGFYVVSLLSTTLSRNLERIRLLYNQVLDSMKEGLLVFDRMDHLVFFNHQAKELLEKTGIQNPENQKIDILFAGPKWKLVRQILEKRKSGSFELPIEGDKELYLGLKVSPIYEGERYKGLTVLLEDLTLKKKLEELEKRALRLEGIEEMALGIAHEIRNPLASIRGCVQELVLDPSVPENRELQKIILEESDRLHRILEEFLNFARPAKLYWQKIWVKELLEQWRALFVHSQKDIQVSLFFEKEDLFFWGDRDKVIQVLHNLGHNALEAEATEVRIEAKESFLPIREYSTSFSLIPAVLVVFEDNGKGMDKNMLKKIFLPFFTTKSRGTGLGLPTVWKILKQHAGHLEVRSTLGRGTEFFLWFPKEKIGEL